MHLSLHDCDLLSAGLVSSEEAATLKSHAAGCQACAALLRDAEATRAAFLVQNPPPARARALLDEVTPRARPRWQWLWAASGAFAALLLFVFLRGGPEVRLKGGGLSCRMMRDGQVVKLLHAGEAAPGQEGDALRCTVVPDKLHHLEVWSVNRTSVEQVTALDVSQPTDLPQAFAVSGHGEQRLYLVWSKSQRPEISQSLAQMPDRLKDVEWVGVVLP